MTISGLLMLVARWNLNTWPAEQTQVDIYACTSRVSVQLVALSVKACATGGAHLLIS